LASEETIAEREIVRTQDGLNHLAAELRACGRFALDTEFAGERTYVPRLCLVQVATPQFIGLIDAQAVSDLKPLWDLVADPSVEKVLHAAREDLRLAYYGSNRLAPQGIYDTQIAAGLVGLSQYPLSYARLVEALAGVRLAKTETRSDWERRPLSPDQIRYARDDVRYLLPIADKLTRILTKLGRSQWLTEEMARFSEPGVYEPDPEEAYLRIRGSRSGLTARPTAVLRAVAAWREREAALRNIPSRVLLRDEVMIDIALRSPKRLTDLPKIKNFPAGEEATIGPDIIEAIEAGKAIPEDRLPPAMIGQDDDTPQMRIVIDLVTAVGSALCLARNVAPELALTKSASAELARGNNPTTQDPASVKRSGQSNNGPSLLGGWRREAVGEELARFVSGAASARVRVVDGEAKVEIEED
jgi:ribonuclease D